MNQELPVPGLNEVTLSEALKALADNGRRAVILDLMSRSPEEHPCSSFDLPKAKSTRTHHWRVLREAGLVTQREVGNGSFVRLRKDEFEARFPGLLQSIRQADMNGA
ncbi:ArsR/SmtB family transcription factor [Salinisphaera hydrothermalis]|uniref:ArsR family transcriptional regulator n=1 Tax=Salinisphaera hydrothermalis (strain C41B8) TaxID=1304275 RepID=A0A084IL86_SALHC|nr:helix-turn-helix transcriptional regulator [Salinisphaera hydrothermalis]KEZ77470.1 ArsR family transcriptional regulator [Salinisphaera hydrothermalis C41B8]